jgi:hypothetical protein
MKIPKKVIRERFSITSHKLYRLMDQNKEIISIPLENPFRNKRFDLSIYHKKKPVAVSGYCKEMFEIYNNRAIKRCVVKKDLYEFCRGKGVECEVNPSMDDMIDKIRDHFSGGEHSDSVSSVVQPSSE